MSVKNPSENPEEKRRRPFAFLNFLNENNKTPQSNFCGSNASTFLRKQEGATIKILESGGLKCHLPRHFQERESRPRKLKCSSSLSSHLSVTLSYPRVLLLCTPPMDGTWEHNTDAPHLKPLRPCVSEFRKFLDFRKTMQHTYHMSHNILSWAGATPPHQTH